jgi:hypothetical protein
MMAHLNDGIMDDQLPKSIDLENKVETDEDHFQFSRMGSQGEPSEIVPHKGIVDPKESNGVSSIISGQMDTIRDCSVEIYWTACISVLATTSIFLSYLVMDFVIPDETNQMLHWFSDGWSKTKDYIENFKIAPFFRH